MASQNYNNWYGQNMGLAQLGQASAAGVGAAGMNMAGNIGNAYNNTANAQASAYGAQGQAFGTLAGSVLGAYKPQSSYGGGSSAGGYGLPSPVDPYANTSWGG